MALSIQILLGVLILAAFVIAFFSARTWHWGYVIVVLGIFLSTLGFLVLAVETLRIYAVFGRQINELETQLARVEAQNEALAKGTEDPNLVAQLQDLEPPVQTLGGEERLLSLAELDHRLLLSTRARGRVWRNVAPAGFDPASGAFRLAAEQPVPAGFRPETVVYLFEEGPAQLPAEDGRTQGGQYLGEFRIVEASGQQATLVPVLPTDASSFEWKRLTSSRGPWVVYETMPVDRHEIFAGMSEEELRKILPPQSVEEYIRHGQEAKPDDPEERQVGYDEHGNRLPPEQLAQATKRVYERRERDYALEFDELARMRIAMQVDIEAVRRDVERLAAALASARELQAFREGEIKRLKSDLAGVITERKAIEAHLARLEQQLKRVTELLAQTLERNSQLVKELARRQGAAEAVTVPTAGANGPLALGIN